MKRIELLAPAGSWEAMVAAVNNGANAVYLSGKAFGARRFAGNFDRQELEKAVAYCHIRDVRVYVTVNTLIADQEFADLTDHLAFLYRIDVDAVIVQDIGVLRMVREAFPLMEVHSSTQMTAHSLEDVRFLVDQGVSRVVLARELTAKEIKTISDAKLADLEVFVHGALCVAYSGQCLMSSMIGGRSGNRGSCAQSCRQVYDLVDLDTGKVVSDKSAPYLLSPKDLCTLEDIPAMIETGAHSFKIEGRMKRPEYAAVVVKAYREAIDAALSNQKLDPQWIQKTERMFTRGFTRGFAMEAPQVDRMSTDAPGHRGVVIGTVKAYDPKKKEMRVALTDTLRPGDEVRINRVGSNVGARVEYIKFKGQRLMEAHKGQVVDLVMKHPVKPGEAVSITVDDNLLKEARGTYHKDAQLVAIKGQVDLRLDQALTLTVSDDRGNVITAQGDLVEKALKTPITLDRIEGQMRKTGGTPFYFTDLEIQVEEGVSVRMSSINALRREVMDQLTLARENWNGRTSLALKETMDQDREPYERLEDWLVVEVRNEAQGFAALEEVPDELILRGFVSKDLMDQAKAQQVPCYFAPHRIMRNHEYLWLEKNLENLKAFDGVYATSWGLLTWLKVKGVKTIRADWSLNGFNSFSIEALRSFGADRVTVSPEATLAQIKAMAHKDARLELLGYGYQPVMITEYCPTSHILAGGQLQCGVCSKSNYGLKDKTGATFPILRVGTSCRTEILNSRRLVMEHLDKLYETGAQAVRVVFTMENKEDVQAILQMVQHTIDKQMTTADFETLRKLKESATNGHYFRGVTGE